MGQTGRFQFSPANVDGSIVGASQVKPTGMDGNIFYEIQDGGLAVNSAGVSSGVGPSKMVGVIAYDYVNSRWSCLFTDAPGLRKHQPTTWEDDLGQIVAFMATLPSAGPVALTDEAGNDVNYPASIPPIRS